MARSSRQPFKAAQPATPAWQSFLFSSAAPSAAAVFTNPFAVAKTQIQVQAAGAKAFRGTFHFFQATFKADGVAGLQRGLVTSIMREASKNVFRLGLYRPIIGRMHEPSQGPAPVWKRMVAGALSGAAGAVSCNPFEVVRVRMQAQSSLATGAHQYGYRGVGDAFRRIVREEGVAGLYKATGASVARSMVGTSVNLTSYTLIRENAVARLGAGDGPVTDVCTALLSGLLTTVAMSPVDVVRTRLMNQPEPPVYRGVAHALVSIVRNEGPRALFLGVWPAYLRLGPHFVLTFVFLEQLRRTAASYNARSARDSALTAVFRSIDADGSGEIDRYELLTAIRAARPFEAFGSGSGREEFDLEVERSANAVFDAADADGNGSIDLPEFLASARSSELDGLLREQQLLAAFRRIDLNGDGQLDELELYSALRDARQAPTAAAGAARVEFERQLRADVKRIMREVDDDGNGVIDFSEFVRAAGKLDDLQDHRVLEGWARSAGVAQE